MRYRPGVERATRAASLSMGGGWARHEADIGPCKDGLGTGYGKSWVSFVAVGHHTIKFKQGTF